MTTHRFPFAFATAHRVAALPFGVLPSTTWVEVGCGPTSWLRRWSLRREMPDRRARRS